MKAFERASDILRNASRQFAAARRGHAARALDANGAQKRALAALSGRLAPAWAAGSARRSNALAALDKLRKSLGYADVLARGYALVRDAARRPLHGAAGILAGDRLEIQFADGRIAAVAGDGAPPKSQPPKRAAPKKPTQDSLF